MQADPKTLILKGFDVRLIRFKVRSKQKSANGRELGEDYRGTWWVNYGPTTRRKKTWIVQVHL